MTSLKKLLIVGAAVLALTGSAFAAKSGKAPLHEEWSFNGVTGTYDRAAVQRGFYVYTQVCASCHSLKYFKFRNLDKMGFSADEIKAVAAEYTVPGEPDDFGDPTERKGLPQDGIPAPFANENAARAANGGALPPDLSVITKARHGGADYIYSLLVGYETTPADKLEAVGDKYYNPYFPGEAIGMAEPLSDGIVEYDDFDNSTEETKEQLAKDVVYFLNYVADPHLEERKETGVVAILYLLVMTILLYYSKKKIWKPVKEGRNVVREAAEKDEA